MQADRDRHTLQVAYCAAQYVCDVDFEMIKQRYALNSVTYLLVHVSLSTVIARCHYNIIKAA